MGRKIDSDQRRFIRQRTRSVKNKMLTFLVLLSISLFILGLIATLQVVLKVISKLLAVKTF